MATLMYLRFKDVYKTADEFIAKVLQPIRVDYRVIPDWIDPTKMYFQERQLYNILLRQYGNRFFRYLDEDEINGFMINHTMNILPQTHIKNKAVLETALTKLFNSDNWGETIKNITKASSQENNINKRNNTIKTDGTSETDTNDTDNLDITNETSTNATGKIDDTESIDVNNTNNVKRDSEKQNLTSTQQQSLGSTIDWTNMVGDQAILDKLKDEDNQIGASKTKTTKGSTTYNSGKDTSTGKNVRYATGKSTRTDGSTTSELGQEEETKQKVDDIDVNTVKNDLVNYMYKINNATMIDNVYKLLWGYNGLFLNIAPRVNGINLGNLDSYIKQYISTANESVYLIPSFKEIPSNELYDQVTVGEYYHISCEYTLPADAHAISTRTTLKGDTITLHVIAYCAYKDDREAQFTMVINGISMYVTAEKTDTTYPVARMDYLSVSEPQKDEHAVNLGFMKNNGRVKTYKSGTVGQIRHLIDQAIRDGREVRLWNNNNGQNQMWVYNQSTANAIQFSKGKNEEPVSHGYGLNDKYYIAIEGVL